MAAASGGNSPAGRVTLAEAFEKYKLIPEYQIQNKGHEPGRIQVHLLVGMGASIPWPLHRAGIHCAAGVFYRHETRREKSLAAIAAALRHRRPARCLGLVYGGIRPVGAD